MEIKPIKTLLVGDPESGAGDKTRNMKTWNNLWDKFLSEENINIAIHNASKGKKKKRRDVARAMADVEKFKEELKTYALNYRNDHHNPKVIYDGIRRKTRTIIVPTFRELVIQHMLVNVLKDMFLKGVYERAYGSIPGRGSQQAKKHIEKWIRDDGRNCKYILKLDIKKYFESIPHDLLKSKLAEEIKDKRILDLLYKIIDKTEKGLPLGFYTSQWLSMWYLKKFDHFIKENLKIPHYVRYADDIVILGSNKRKLAEALEAIEKELAGLGLKLNNRSQLFRFVYIRNGKIHGRELDFMGFRFFRNRTTLRRSIYYKMVRKARRVSKKDKITVYECRQMLSYLGWIKCTDTYRAYTLHVKPCFNIRRAKKRISNYDRRIKRCLLDEKTATIQSP